ncbi:hypothetical protein Bca4012_038584 [Brassica carinata]
MSSLYTQFSPLLATGANNVNRKEMAMTMIQQPNTVVSPPSPKKQRNQSGNPKSTASQESTQPSMEAETKVGKRSEEEGIHLSEPTCVHHDPSHALGDLTGIKKHYYRKHCEKKWECKKCPKSYALLSDWKTHSKICGTKVYGCDCGTTFSRRNNYISHKTFCIALKQEPARNPTVSFPEMGAASGGSGVRHGFYGGAASAVGKQDFYARAVSSLDRHGFYGGAASALPHNQFSNNSNTGFNPPATGYNLNHSSSKNFEDLVPQPTKPNHSPTNFRMQYSSNQGLLAHNDPTLRSQHNLISVGDMINNNNSPNPGYFQNNTKNSNQAIFTHGAANNNPEMGAASAGSGVRHGVYGGAASALPHNQFGNNSNTGFYPPAASYNLNHSSSKTFEHLVPQPTKPNPAKPISACNTLRTKDCWRTTIRLSGASTI